MKKELLDIIRNSYKPGSRVELVKMNDTQAPPIGTRGTVIGVDDIGSILVSWDNGSSLNVVYGEDRVEIVNTCPKCGKEYKGYPALSRVDNKTYICPLCGVKESLDAAGINEKEQEKIIKIVRTNS